MRHTGHTGYLRALCRGYNSFASVPGFKNPLRLCSGFNHSIALDVTLPSHRSLRTSIDTLKLNPIIHNSFSLLVRTPERAKKVSVLLLFARSGNISSVISECALAS
jgi:hypothetical protein